MSDEFDDITPAPRTGPLKLKDVQAKHPELVGPPAAAATPAASVAAAPLPADVPWYQCWNVDEAHPNDGSQYSVEGGGGREVRTAELHPPFQSSADVARGQYPACPVCSRVTVQPLEHYRPSVPV